MSLVIGLDFGTESVRAVLIDTEHGSLVATSARSYQHGVIDAVLPGTGKALLPDWALQHPDDWLFSASQVVRDLVRLVPNRSHEVVGIGIDFTSCTVLPVDTTGMPLCKTVEFNSEPHAWAKLWKHHASHDQARRATDVAVEMNAPWISRYGGRISSEWFIPKALEILEEAPDVYAAADRIMEAADWIVWQLTGVPVRSSCQAGYKAQWHAEDGFPSSDYLTALNPDLGNLFSSKLRDPVLSPGEKAGTLTDEWASSFGLPTGVAVAVPLIDAHAAAIGGGTHRAGDLFMIMGTSTCHLLLGDRQVDVPGIAGVVRGGIVPDLFGYEAGQPATGDALAWFVEHALPGRIDYVPRGNDTVHDLLSEKARRLRPGASGLLALDWLNGNRSILVDANLSGLILGIGLRTRPEDIYRALVESTAFGTRMIIDTFAANGLPTTAIRAGGSLVKNDFVAQIYADVLQREIFVVDSPEVSARGAAVLGGTAAGVFESTAAGIEQVGTRIARTFVPDAAHREAYETLYAEYARLYTYFGEGENPVMQTLKRLKLEQRPERPEQDNE